jgi:hypothetical protein
MGVKALSVSEGRQRLYVGCVCETRPRRMRRRILARGYESAHGAAAARGGPAVIAHTPESLRAVPTHRRRE